MTPRHTKLLERFPKVCRTIVLNRAEAVGFGEGNCDDVVVVKPLKKPVIPAITYTDGKISKTPNSPEALYNRYRALLDKGSVGSFTLSKTTFNRLKRAKKKLDATHLRLHSDNDGIHLSLFDIRRFVPEARLKRKHDQMLIVDTVSAQERYRFGVTLSAEAISLLPTADSLVTVDPYGLVKFAYSDGDIYLIRNQKLVPPITTFVSAPLGKDIAFWLYSN